DGVLRLPSPVVPQVIGDVAPERMAPGLTGRFFLIESAAGFVNGPRLEAGALFRFTHRPRCLQKTQMSRVFLDDRLSVCRFQLARALSREVASGRQLSKTRHIHADATVKLTKYK